jgi:hypothetical protein
MMTTATGLARAREHVWEVAVVLVGAWEKGEGERRAESTGLGSALSCPGRVHARSGAFWASRARRVLCHLVLSWAMGKYMQVQGIQAKLQDMGM